VRKWQKSFSETTHVSANSFLVKFTYKFLFSSLLAPQPCVDVDTFPGLIKIDFFLWWGCKPHVQPLIWWMRHYTSSGPYPFTCLALMALRGAYPPASIVLRVTG
jgi:hypothetical protein